MSKDPPRSPWVWNRSDNAGVAFRLAVASGLWLMFAWIKIWPRGWDYTYVNFGWWQWLPRGALQQEPLTSIWLLHAQPPLMNAVLALSMQLDELGWMRFSHGATLFMAFATWMSCLVWLEVAWRLLRSFMLAFIVTGLVVLNPSLDALGCDYHYPNVEMFELGILTLMAERWTRRPEAGRLIVLILAWGVLIYTRALWHPVTGIFLGMLLAAHLRCRGAAWARSLGLGAGCALLCIGLAAPWAVKNLYLFNTGSFSSWVGVNTQNLAMSTNPLWEFSQSLQYDPALVRHYYSDAQWARLQGHPAVTLKTKGEDGPNLPNMNFLGVPALGAEAVRSTLKAYRENPWPFFRGVAQHWVQTDLPAYYRIYSYNYETGTYDLMNPSAYNRAFDRIYYGSWLRPYWSMRILDDFWRPSFYILTIYPIALIGAVRRLGRLRRPRGFVSSLLLGAIFWVWAMILLVDGNEGGRMRWHIEPAILILFFWTLIDLRRCFQVRRRFNRQRAG